MHVCNKYSPLSWQFLLYRQASKSYVTQLMHGFLLVLSKGFCITNNPVLLSALGKILVIQAIQILHYQLIWAFLKASIVYNGSLV